MQKLSLIKLTSGQNRQADITYWRKKRKISTGWCGQFWIWLGETTHGGDPCTGRYIQCGADSLGIALVLPHLVDILVQEDIYRVVG
jgi:hypothetical protein